MRLLLEDVPLMISKTVNFRDGKIPVAGSSKILLDKDLDRRIIDFKNMDRAMCKPGEVNRTLQVCHFFKNCEYRCGPLY